MHLPSLKEQFDNPDYSWFYNFISYKMNDLLKSLQNKCSPSELIAMLICDPKITNIVQFRAVYKLLLSSFKLIFPAFEIKSRILYLSKDTMLDDEVLNEVIYIYKLGWGIEEEKPPVFGPDEQAAKAFYEKAKLAEEKIARIKAENNKDAASNKDGLMNMFTIIAYRFPYTFEQLYDMTMFQLLYLRNISLNMISYENSMSAYTAGNLKKAPKFFIK